jgi:hypothetical protein
MADDSNEEYLLTTVDNPWNPFTNYDEWYEFDHTKGYDTPGLLARIAKVSIDLSDADFELAIELAIDEVVEQNVSGMHQKVYRPTDVAA